jgi:hypothetical protein
MVDWRTGLKDRCQSSSLARDKHRRELAIGRFDGRTAAPIKRTDFFMVCLLGSSFRLLEFKNNAMPVVLAINKNPFLLAGV